MKVIAAIVALLALTVLLACGGGTDAPGDDGGAAPAAAGDVTAITIDERTVLEVPDGALPADVSVDDLHVQPGGVTLLEAVEGGPEPLASYRLEPTGLAFAEPVTLRVTVPLEDVPASVVTFLATEGQEAPELVPTRLENRDEEVGQLRHQGDGAVPLHRHHPLPGHLLLP